MNEIETEINKTIHNNKLVKINNQIFLTNYEIDILNLYKINFNTCNNYQEILFFIEEELELNEDSIELEQILLSISERNYYQNTHK